MKRGLTRDASSEAQIGRVVETDSACSAVGSGEERGGTLEGASKSVLTTLLVFGRAVGHG